MGAFETFVNANLGIRKPLITDVGHPSGSFKAAGIIGSQYLDSSNNFLYEKTGDNNQLDWVKIRELGQSADNPLQSVSDSLEIPVGISTTGIMFDEISTSFNFSSLPNVVASMQFHEESDSFYAYSVYNVSSTGFYVSFSDTIIESGHKLNVNIS